MACLFKTIVLGALCALVFSSAATAESDKSDVDPWPLQDSNERGCCVISLPDGETRCQFTHRGYCERIADGASFDFRPQTTCRALPQCRAPGLSLSR